MYSKIVIALLQLVMVPVLATRWGLPLYGQWLLLSAIPLLLVASDFGFGTAAGNGLIGEVASGDDSAARTTFQSALAVVLGSSTTVFALVVAVSTLVPDHLFEVSGGMDADAARAVLIVLSAWIIVATQSNLFIAAMRAHGAFALSAIVEATVQLAEGLAVIAIVLAGGTPLEAAFGYLIVRSVGVVGHIVLALRRAPWLALGFGDARRARMSELRRPALAAMMLPLAQAGFLQGAALAVGAAAGAAAVPIFTSLRTLSRVGLQLVLSLNLPIMPEFTAEHALGNLAWLQRVTGALVTINAVAGATAGLALIFGGNFFLDRWTNGVISAPQAMISLTAAGLAAGAVWNSMSYCLLAVNRHERFAYVFGVSACMAVILTYALVRIWGVTGAAAASLLLDLAMLGLVITQLRLQIGAFPLGLSAVRALLRQRWW